MTINWLHLLVLLLQCLVQSWFLSRYFDAGRRGFLIYAGFFCSSCIRWMPSVLWTGCC